MRDLNRQLGTPSHWFYLWIPAKKGKRAPQRPFALRRSSQPARNTKNYAPPYRSTAYSTLKVVKRKLCLVYIFSSWQRSFPSPLYVTSRLEQATREFLENLPKVRTSFPTFKALFKLLPYSKRLKAHLIIKRSAFNWRI